ncbi:unnamed protein product [Brugia timori]|uniref:KRAB domain-containing protein n=1 Tax=Brugia timori TaxID=42155 RepID=A0A0R3Q3M4_9BILA|nr:unnamed protein product [Brugia timori]
MTSVCFHVKNFWRSFLFEIFSFHLQGPRNFLENQVVSLKSFQECKEAWEDYEREKVNPTRGVYGNLMEQTQANMVLLHEQG